MQPFNSGAYNAQTYNGYTAPMAPVAAPLSMAWHVTQAVSAVKFLVWHVTEAVDAALVIAWHVTKPMSSQLDFSWNYSIQPITCIALVWNLNAANDGAFANLKPSRGVCCQT